MFRKIQFCTIAVAALLSASLSANAQIASEDFDGGDVNLLNGFNPNDEIYILPSMFGVFELDEFDMVNQASFALVDDSVADVSGGGAFPNDFEGIYGMARAGDDAFFCAVSAGDGLFDLNDLITSWEFDVSSANGEPLTLSIDMGQMSNDSFGGVPADNFVLLEYRFDGGTFQEAIAMGAIELVGEPTGFNWRPMDSGNVATIDFDGDGTHLGLAVTTPGVTKLLVEDGSVAPDVILNKTPPMGDGAGLLDTYTVDLVGSGSTLELRLSCDFDFEAFSLDNIVITAGGSVLKGDVNLDGLINLLDVNPFVDELQSGGNQAEADTNCDGEVNLLDVGPFVDLLGGG